ncbi:MAG: PIN domain-containing protein [Bacteroidaceae bacterium]|nr:PIN domain-containing protein [Bacteroidaceae bacterium]
MAGYLLDTDICIEIFKHNEKVLDRIDAVGQEHCFVTEITIAELYYGAAKSGRSQHYRDVEFIQRAFGTIPLTSSLQLYGTNKAELEKTGSRIGEFDLLIGSCAVHNKLVMVTSNVRHFDHIPDIQIEDWAGKSRYKR